MILDWKTHRVITDMKETTYKQQYMRIHEKGPGDFIGFIGDLDHHFTGDSFEDVEKQMIDFVG